MLGMPKLTALKRHFLTNVKVMMKRVNTLNEVAVKDP